MKINEIKEKAEDLNEQGKNAVQMRNNARAMVAAANIQLSSAQTMLNMARQTDENGNPKGDIFQAQNAVMAATARLNAAQSRLQAAEYKIGEINRKKTETINEIDNYSSKEERNLEILKSIQKKRFGNNTNSFINNLIEKLNKGQDIKALLEESMGKSGNKKSYTALGGAEVSDESNDLKNDNFTGNDFGLKTDHDVSPYTKEEAAALLMKGFKRDDGMPMSQVNQSVLAAQNYKPLSYESSENDAIKRVNSSEAIQTARQYGDAWISQLSTEEKRSITDYTGQMPPYYENINGFLRKKVNKLDSGNAERITHIHNALQKAKLPCDMIAFRRGGESILGALKGKSDEEIIGSAFLDRGYVSSSLKNDRNAAGDVRLEIDVGQG